MRDDDRRVHDAGAMPDIASWPVIPRLCAGQPARTPGFPAHGGRRSPAAWAANRLKEPGLRRIVLQAGDFLAAIERDDDETTAGSGGLYSLHRQTRMRTMMATRTMPPEGA